MESEKTLPVIAQLGYDCAEFFLNSHSEFSTEFILKIKRLCSDFGIVPVSVHPYTAFAEPFLFFSNYPRRFEDGLELYKKYFHSSALLGARFFHIHGATSRQEKTVPPELYAERYFALRQAAAAEGIELCQENVVNHLCGDAVYLKRLKDLLGDEISFNLDIKQANLAGRDPFLMAEIMGDRMRFCHINDFSEEQPCLLPGFGTFDLKKLICEVQNSGYQGVWMTEVYSHNYSSLDEILESKRCLAKILHRGEKA